VKKQNKMKTQKLQDIAYIKSYLRRRQAKNRTAWQRLKHHFRNAELKGNGANRDQIEDEEIVCAAESGDMSDSESKDEEARGLAGDDDVREGQSFTRFVQAARGATAADSDDEDVGEVVETNPSVGPSDVHGPASSHGPGQARPGQSHNLTTALAWPKIFESQNCRLRPWLLSEFSALWESEFSKLFWPILSLETFFKIFPNWAFVPVISRALVASRTFHSEW
jgi:hypothetical protein